MQKADVSKESQLTEPTAATLPKNFYKTLVERSPDCMILMGAEGGILYVSPGITAILGYSLSEIADIDLATLIHSEDLEPFRMDFADLATRPGDTVSSECRARHKDGTWRWLEASGVNLLHDPSVQALVIDARDVTERKQVEEDLRYKSALLESQNEATRDGILVVDTKGKMLFHNRQFEKMWKIPKHIMQAKDDTAALDYGMSRLVDPTGFRKRIEYLYTHQDEVSHELIYFKDGQILSRYGAPVTDKTGMTYGFAWYFRDVTEEKKVEQSIQTQNEYLTALQETAVALTQRLDVVPLLNTIIEHAGEIADTEHGYIYLVDDNTDELSVKIGTGVFKEFLGHTIKKGDGIAGKVWQTGKALVVDDYDSWEGRSQSIPNGTFSAVVCVPLKSAGKVVGAIALARQEADRSFDRDQLNALKRISELASIALDNAYLYEQVRRESAERMQAQAMSESLVEQQQRQMEINQTKDEFITLASHQLRTPATGVKQYLGMVLGGYVGDLTADQQQLLELANESNERQLVIINDLLQVAHLDTGRVSLQRQPTHVIDMLSDVIDEQADTFKNRKQGVKFLHDMQEVTIRADADRLRMVLENIIDNASKYSRHGTTVTISVERTAIDLVIKIQDQGVGIRQRDLNKLFKKFSRIDNPLSTLVGGTGLGLYWAKQVIDLHGGSISVSSKLNKGTCFAINLPL